MASTGASARRKGHQFERDIANLFTEETGKEFKRGLNQSRGGGAEGSDVVSSEVPELHFELKRHKRCNIKAAMRQADADIEAQGGEKMPVIVTKDDRGDTLVTMKMDNWLEFFNSYLAKR